jgi:hypothetical protein
LPSTVNSTCSAASLPSMSSTSMTVVCLATCDPPAHQLHAVPFRHAQQARRKAGSWVFQGTRYVSRSCE